MRLLVALLPLFLGCGADATRKARAPDGEAVVKVMTFNVNFGLAGDPATLAAIRAGDADIVVLQETTAAWEQAIRADLAAAYPHMAFRHCCGAGGLAILSRAPVVADEYLPPAEGWFPAWRLVADSPIGRLQLLAVHLRPPVSDSGSFAVGYFSTRDDRQREIEAYAARLDAGLPTLVLGDFNERDGRAIRFLEARGLRSVLPEYHPDADTWRWTTSVGTIHSQLDHIAYDPRLEPLDARVLEVGRSDHYPVIATFTRAR